MLKITQVNGHTKGRIQYGHLKSNATTQHVTSIPCRQCLVSHCPDRGAQNSASYEITSFLLQYLNLTVVGTFGSC